MSDQRMTVNTSGVDVKALLDRQEEAAAHGFAWAVDALPRVLPATWRTLRETEDGAMYERNGLKVIMSGAVEADGRRWLHVSCSRVNRLPDWDDMRTVKDLFVGVDRQAIQVFPTRARYVNINSNVLHLWSCLDGDGLPDFSGGTGSI